MLTSRKFVLLATAATVLACSGISPSIAAQSRCQQALQMAAQFKTLAFANERTLAVLHPAAEQAVAAANAAEGSNEHAALVQLATIQSDMVTTGG